MEKSKKCWREEELDKFILNECKNNKNYLSNSGIFKTKFQILYNKKHFNIKENHLNYLFTKYKKLCFPKNLDDIYDYFNIAMKI